MFIGEVSRKNIGDIPHIINYIIMEYILNCSLVLPINTNQHTIST